MIFKKFAMAAILAAAAFAAAPASASTNLYNYTATDDFGVINLILTADSAINGFGGHDLLDASGFFNGIAVLGVVAPFGAANNDGYAIYDNVLYTDDPYYDNAGWLFALANGDKLNLYSVAPPLELDPSYAYVESGALGNPGALLSDSLLTAIPSAVPEPATWAMFLMGFGVVGFGMRSSRGRKQVAVTA